MSTCAHCKTEFRPKPRRNRHGVFGEPQGARFCSSRCRLRAHRSRSRVLGSVQDPRQTPAEGGMARETPLDHVHLPGGRETPLEAPIIRESKPPSQKLDPRIVPDEKWPGMYRIRRPDGTLSVMVNLTRAKEALLYAINAGP